MWTIKMTIRTHDEKILNQLNDIFNKISHPEKLEIVQFECIHPEYWGSEFDEDEEGAESDDL